MALPAYWRICTVSRPESSSKNHPQLVYISMACLCISRSLRTMTVSSISRFLDACFSRNLLIFSSERSRMTSMYSSLAFHGSFRYSFALCSYLNDNCSLSQSSACRRGALHSCFHSGCPPELHPQLFLHLSMP